MSEPTTNFFQRLLDEWRNPSAKCKRLGHRKQKSMDKVLLDASGTWSAIAKTATRTRTKCKRCGRTFGRPSFSNKEPVHSLSMTSSQADEFEKTGVHVLYRIGTKKVPS